MSKAAEEAQRLLEKGELKPAMMVVNAGLNKDPDDMALLMLGACIVSRESCHGMAYNVMKRVIANSPAYPEALNNLAMSASSLASTSGKDKYLDEAEALLRKAYRKRPIVEVIANLALVLFHQCRYAESEKRCREGLGLDPGNLGCRETLGYARLYQGDWAEGFGNWDLGSLDNSKHRKVPQGKYWERGERGKKLYIRGEQGIGDEISFASVLPQACKDNDITFDCDPRLEGLMRRSLPGVKVFGAKFEDKKPFPNDFDSVALVGSLCMEYRREDADFPGAGYLIADPERRLQWKTLLDTLPGRKIGIAWTGGLDNTFKHRRSFGLEGLLPILKTPGVTWVSLQYNDPSAEIEAFTAKHGIQIHHWKRAVEKGVDYDETAALVSELECVVSVTTAMVHLCGALGQKCHVLVPKKCRWFYNSDTNKHRWYESLELYRQSDKWPVERIAARL